MREPSLIEKQGVYFSVEQALDGFNIVDNAIIGGLSDGQNTWGSCFFASRAKGFASIFFRMFSGENSSRGIGPIMPR